MSALHPSPPLEGVDLTVQVGSLTLQNPVLLASGTAGYGAELSQVLNLSELGGLVTKGIAMTPWEGNPPPRLAETRSGLLNAIGLQNVGLHRFTEEKMPFLRQMGSRVVVNVIGKTVEEYADVARALQEVPGIDALELNISCPNIKEGGIQFGTSCEGAALVTLAVRKATTLPLWVKLSPNVTDIAAMARAVEGAGADALSVINTLLGLVIDLDSRRPVLANVYGGLSGPAIKPVALRMVRECWKAVKIPVVGMGGIWNAQDALEFMVCGASAVQVGTVSFTHPRAAAEIVEGMKGWCAENGVARIRDLVGTLR